MNTALDPKLIDWLRSTLSDITDRPVTVVKLIHAADGGQPEPIALYETDEGNEADDLAQEIWQAAARDAASRTPGSVQRYAVAAYRHSEYREEGEFVSQFPIVMEGGMERQRLNLEDTYPANERGALGQGMAQNQQMHQLMFQTSSYFVNQSRLDLERERKRRIELEDRAIDLMREREDLLDRKQERELRQAKEEESARRMRQMMDMLMKFAPVLMSQVTGGLNLAGGKTVNRDMKASRALESLTMEDISAMLAPLSQEKQQALLELYAAHAEQKKEDDQGLHPMLKDPEEEVH